MAQNVGFRLLLVLLLSICSTSCALFPSGNNQILNIPVVINEFLTSSSTDDDWVELYNYSNAPVGLSGFYLSDSSANLTRWVFQDGAVIAGYEYLIVYANGDDDDYETNFGLGPDEEIVFTAPDGTTIIDYKNYSLSDVPPERSFGRFPDADPAIWITFTIPTKGFSNN